MTRIFTSFFALLFASSAVFAQKQTASDSEGLVLKAHYAKGPIATQAAPASYFGYADATVEQLAFVGVNQDAIIGQAIKLPAMGGNKLKKVRFHANQDSQDGNVFVIATSSSELKLVQNLQIKTGWNDVTLSTPFEMVNSEEYYVGYQIKAKAQPGPLSFDDQRGQTTPGVNMVLTSASMFNMSKPLVNRKEYLNLDDAGLNFGNSMIFVEVDDNKGLLDNVAQLINATLLSADELKAGAEAKFKVTVRNLGFKPITSATFAVKSTLKGQEVQQELTGLNIAPQAKAELELKMKAPQRGLGIASARLAKVNSKNAWFNNAGLVPYRVATPNGEGDRKTVLLERFTTEKCGNCPRVDKPIKETIQQMESNGFEVSYIAHHAGFYTDFLTLNESIELLPYAFNKAGRTFAPAFMVNRFPSTDLSKDNGAELACLQSLDTRTNAALQSKEAVRFTRYVKIEKEGKYALEVEGVAGYVDLDNFYLTAVITEDGVPARQQAGASAGYLHDGAARAFMTPALGKLITPNADGTFKVTTDAVELEDDWQKEKMKIVFFVHKNMSSPLIDQRQVYASKSFAFNSTGAAEQLLDAKAPRIYTHEGYLVVDADVSELAVYDLAGCLVSTSADRRLAKGVYVVRVANTYGTFSQKVIVE
ncbi:MAG: hypothetical protein Q4A64_04780 [Porphyromonadaceae bacterium]|nr:hypothetical protein [Porphyromonadaceae bacterium]